MTMEEDLLAVLLTVCPRAFCDFAPTDTPRPYVTYQQIGGAAVTFLDGARPSKRNAIMQINVWDDDRLEANALASQIEDALTAATQFQARPNGAFASDFDPDMERYGTRQDFDIWADR